MRTLLAIIAGLATIAMTSIPTLRLLYRRPQNTLARGSARSWPRGSIASFRICRRVESAQCRTPTFDKRDWAARLGTALERMAASISSKHFPFRTEHLPNPGPIEFWDSERQRPVPATGNPGQARQVRLRSLRPVSHLAQDAPARHGPPPFCRKLGWHPPPYRNLAADGSGASNAPQYVRPTLGVVGNLRPPLFKAQLALQCDILLRYRPDNFDIHSDQLQEMQLK